MYVAFAQWELGGITSWFDGTRADDGSLEYPVAAVPYDIDMSLEVEVSQLYNHEIPDTDDDNFIGVNGSANNLVLWDNMDQARLSSSTVGQITRSTPTAPAYGNISRYRFSGDTDGTNYVNRSDGSGQDDPGSSFSQATGLRICGATKVPNAVKNLKIWNFAKGEAWVDAA